MFKKAYVEISNVCNLSCSFCPGTRRLPRFMSAGEFRAVCSRLSGHTRFLYFHLMGEPLLHPELAEFLDIAGEMGFRVVISTNGSLLPRAGEILLRAPSLHRVNISLQSFETPEDAGGLKKYVDGCARFASAAAEKGIICCFRLWNGGSVSVDNGPVISALEAHFPPPWTQTRANLALAPRVFLDHGERFDWPGQDKTPDAPPRFCYGLRDQIGVLCDGTVVPCCLDSDGSIPLGNIFEDSLEDIIASPRARAIYEGFSRGRAVEELCRSCGYATRF